jgi:MYND finger
MAQHPGREQKKSQKRFDALFAEGRSLCRFDEPTLAAAEKLLQAVHAAPLVWTKHRLWAFAAALALRSNVPDIAFIHEVTTRFLENENEPVQFRSYAAFWTAAQYIRNASIMNVSTAAELLRLGLDIIAASLSKMKKDDENRKVMHHPHTQLHLGGDTDFGTNDVTLTAILAYINKKLTSVLSHLVNLSLSHIDQHNVTHVQMQDRTRAGGLVCDCCGKTLAELKMTCFMQCSRCLMVFYCSTTCQREHWKKKGHNKACRAKGQIEIGDVMLIHHKESAEGVSYCELVTVISSLGGNLWQVKHYAQNGETVTVTGDELIRIRPPSTLL